MTLDCMYNYSVIGEEKTPIAVSKLSIYPLKILKSSTLEIIL